MSSAPFQEELFTHPTAISGTVFVNDRVCIQTEEDQRVISVHGVIFSHYSINDRAAEAYAMVLLFESGYADQNDIARGFGYSVRSLRRYQERLKAGGLSALARPRGRPSGHKKTLERDQTILRLKTKGMSNRWVAGRLGLSETAVRKSLLRLGWKSDSAPDAQPALPFLPEASSQNGAISNRFGGKKSRCQPSRSLHGSPLGRHGATRRCASVVCSNAKPAQSRCVVGYSRARCQWPTLHRRENLRQPRPGLLRTANHSGGVCSVGASEDPSTRSSQRISAWRTGSHCRLGSHAGSEDSAPQ